jgi:SAM-dependent methyltransferase
VIREFLLRLKRGTEELNYGRNVLARYVLEIAAGKTNLRILDIGLGQGKDLINIRERCAEEYPGLKLECYGFEYYQPYAAAARAQSIHVFAGDVERDRYPFDDQSFDVVVANQIVEHTKDIFWIYSEISRILTPQGFILTGVPNLASFHNRMALLFGIQPTGIEVLGPHVRGFTAGSFIKFIETDGYFVNRAVRGSNFYPFRPAISGPLSRLFPLMSFGIFFKTERTEKPGTFIEVLKSRFFETSYFAGDVTSKEA